MDYTTLSTTVTFGPSTNERQVSISITDDDIIEGVESFLCIITLPEQNPLIAVTRSNTAVIIMDNDGM